MIYGYARISTHKQSIERQVRNILEAYPNQNVKIIEEVFTGCVCKRPCWDKLMKRIKEGDTIVFDSVSRMSRSGDEGVATYMELYNKGVNLVFLKESYINTDVYKKTMESSSIALTGTEVDCILTGVNEYLMLLAEKQVKLAFEQAEKEVEDLRQRTIEGLETARREGKQIGQRKGATLNIKMSYEAKVNILMYSKKFGGTMNRDEILKFADIAKNTYYKYSAELTEELKNGAEKHELIKKYKKLADEVKDS